jgi:AcrR family transcriptional regulator
MHATTVSPDRRDKILDAAFAVLSTDGLRSFTQTRVAARAKIRQSHLTYYFPTRADLIEALAARALDGITANIAAAAPSLAAWGPGQLVGALADYMTSEAHARMFVGMIVEADRDPTIRAIIVRGSARVRAAIAVALGGGVDAERQARVIQAAIWGLGLYLFAVRPAPDADPTHDMLNYLEEFAR